MTEAKYLELAKQEMYEEMEKACNRLGGFGDRYEAGEASAERGMDRMRGEIVGLRKAVSTVVRMMQKKQLDELKKLRQA